jgi:putative ABC transport system ATP-binding protein
MNIAEQYGDTVIVMEDGKIIARIDKSKQKIQASQLKSMIKSKLTATT